MEKIGTAFEIRLFYGYRLETNWSFHRSYPDYETDLNTMNETQIGGIAVFDKILFFYVCYQTNHKNGKWQCSQFDFQAISLN